MRFALQATQYHKGKSIHLPDEEDPIGQSPHSTPFSSDTEEQERPRMEEIDEGPITQLRKPRGGGVAPPPKYATRLTSSLLEDSKDPVPDTMHGHVSVEANTLRLDIRGIYPELYTSFSIPNPRNCLDGPP